MKKSFVLASILTMALVIPNTASFAACKNQKSSEMHKCPPPCAKEMPKLYDKNGNELKNPPKPGDKVYDKNGKELQPPCKMHKGPELNLSDKQKAEADKIREASKQKIKPIRKDIHDLKNQIWEIKENDNLTKEQKHEQIKPLMEKIQKLHQQANEIRQEDMKKFENILTKEQKETLEKFKKEHKQHHKHKRPMPPAEDFE